MKDLELLPDDPQGNHVVEEKLAELIAAGWSVVNTTSKGHGYLLKKGNCRKGHYFSVENGEYNVNGYMV